MKIEIGDYERPCPVCEATHAEIEAFLHEKGLPHRTFGEVMDSYREPHNWLQDQGFTNAWLTEYRSHTKEER